LGSNPTLQGTVDKFTLDIGYISYCYMERTVSAVVILPGCYLQYTYIEELEKGSISIDDDLREFPAERLHSLNSVILILTAIKHLSGGLNALTIKYRNNGSNSIIIIIIIIIIVIMEVY
jgi:hypothetical protein